MHNIRSTIGLPACWELELRCPANSADADITGLGHCSTAPTAQPHAYSNGQTESYDSLTVPLSVQLVHRKLIEEVSYALSGLHTEYGGAY